MEAKEKTEKEKEAASHISELQQVAKSTTPKLSPDGSSTSSQVSSTITQQTHTTLVMGLPYHLSIHLSNVKSLFHQPPMVPKGGFYNPFIVILILLLTSMFAPNITTWNVEPLPTKKIPNTTPYFNPNILLRVSLTLQQFPTFLLQLTNPIVHPFNNNRTVAETH